MQELSKDKNILLFALYWPLNESPDTIMRTCSERIVIRGDNHQSLHPDEDKSHENALQMFLSQTQSLDESEVDIIETMDVTEDIEESLARAVDACVRVLGVKRPSREEIGRALSAVHNYTPSISTPKKNQNNHKRDSETPWLYYGFLPEFNLESTLNSALTSKVNPTPEQKDAQCFWSSLQAKRRISTYPHVTIVHSNSLPGAQALWDACAAVCRHAATAYFQMKLGHIVYDDKAMAITIDSINLEEEESKGVEGVSRDFLAALSSDVRNKLHITIGTRDAKVNAVEAGKMVERWRAEGGGARTNAAKAVPLVNVVVRGKLRGMGH